MWALLRLYSQAPMVASDCTRSNIALSRLSAVMSLNSDSVCAGWPDCGWNLGMAVTDSQWKRLRSVLKTPRIWLSTMRPVLRATIAGNWETGIGKPFSSTISQRSEANAASEESPGLRSRMRIAALLRWVTRPSPSCTTMPLSTDSISSA